MRVRARPVRERADGRVWDTSAYGDGPSARSSAAPRLAEIDVSVVNEAMVVDDSAAAPRPVASHAPARARRGGGTGSGTLKERLALAESPRDLYAAAAALTGRQYDVFAMRHFLDFSTDRFAFFTKLASRTVDYRRRRAREDVSRRLGVPTEPRKKEMP
ncbi:hypothetical protein ACFY1V_07355 [Streptomyces sp. NPDC001255]|uniref:hypothetical protein n=1 Tax=Streptomyces sp. NPDC001255 TaxID=3364550 RepID=UPI0036CFDAB7